LVSVAMSPSGEAWVNGEYWSSELESGSDERAEVGTYIEVVSVAGNHLMVKPTSEERPFESDIRNSEQ